MKKKTSKHPLAPSPAITHFPSPINREKNSLSNEEKIHQIASHFREIMNILGLDLTHESLKTTPERVAKMYVEEIFAGLDETNFPNIHFFNEEISYGDHPSMILIKVGFTSFCEHHFVPMIGHAYVAYLPKNKLIGLSKIPRLVRFFASRPQLQERLTAQIADSLAILLDSNNVAVSLHAQHHCVIARGIEDESSRMITHVLRGKFDSDAKLGREFFESISRQDL